MSFDLLDTSAPAADAQVAADVAAAASDASDFGWLVGVQAGLKAWDGVRFACMRGTGRIWACDGEYVACRPKDFHPKTSERHARFLASGHYNHVGTFDDVQVFELLPGSPFRRDNRTLIPGVNLYQDMRECAIAAVKRDWVLYTDILEAVAANIKAKFHEQAARDLWTDVLGQIEQSIRLRGGPTQAECGAGLANVRARRGLGKARAIALPPR